MPILSKPSSAAHMAVLYITLGALIDVWSGIWLWYLQDNPPQTGWQFYVCWGLLLTGVTLLVIGITLGQIGRAARHAEMPPEEVTATVARAEVDAAHQPQVMVPVTPEAPMATPVAGEGVPPRPIPYGPPVATTAGKS